MLFKDIVWRSDDCYPSAHFELPDGTWVYIEHYVSDQTKYSLWHDADKMTADNGVNELQKWGNLDVLELMCVIELLMQGITPEVTDAA